MPTDAQWLSLCCCTESNRPHEWPFVAWTIRRRVEANRVMFGGNTYQGVILKPMQFSAFNGVLGTPDQVYSIVSAEQDAASRTLAEHCAAWVLGTPTQNGPISALSFYYFSPISMVPAGKLPAWDWNKLRRFSVSQVDPYRFIFAEEIRA